MSLVAAHSLLFILGTEHMSSDWKANRDALIEETMAFVANVNQSTSSLNLNTSGVRPANEGRPVAETLQPPQAIKFIDSERAAMKQRVKSFKAHQERLIREREAFANAALKIIRPSNTR